MNPTPPEGKPKTRLVLIVVGALATLAIIGGAVYALVLAGTQKTDTNTKKPEATKTQTVESGETLTQGAEKLNKAVDKEKAQREKAQQALNDHVKRTDLSN